MPEWRFKGIVSGEGERARNTVLLFAGHQEFEVDLTPEGDGSGTSGALESRRSQCGRNVGRRVEVTVRFVDG